MLKQPKIFIDPGHGGSDPGAVNRSLNLVEADIALQTGLYLREILRTNNCETMMSRESNISPQQRWQLANQWGADLYVSLHINAGGGTGFETLIPTASPNNPQRDLVATRQLAELISNDLGQYFNLPVRRANGAMLETESHFVTSGRGEFLGVLRNTSMIAIMPELGFIDAPTGRGDIPMLQHRRKEMAEVLAKTILAFLGVCTIPEPIPVPTPEHPFIDVPEGHWSNEAFSELHKRKIINGIAPGILGGFGQPMEIERVSQVIWNLINYFERRD